MKTGFSTSHPRLSIAFVIALYALPILFFFISYFLITTSGEDIWQGAHNFRSGLVISPIDDAINAFNYNSRITDMYAWTVIDFFDYQFAFGPDTIFRLIDVVMSSLVFYLATYIILGRRPKLQLRDAGVFCACFVAVIVTPFGRPFYHEFSMIHNYVPLVLAMLAFSIPYLNLIRKNPPVRHLRLLAVGMLLLGIYFGMAATVTPLAFLGAVFFYCIIKRKTLTRPPAWFFTGIIGVIVGFSVCWFFGSGIDHYTNPATATAFDYIPFADIFSNIPRLFYHEFYNFGIALLPLIIIAVVCIIFVKNRRFTLSFKKTSAATRRLALAFSIFILLHLLAVSLVKAPPRLTLPAYFAGVILLLYFFTPKLNSRLLGSCVVFLTTLILATHIALRVTYHHDMATVLSEIESSPESSLCVELSRVAPPRIRIIDLSQANILVNWEEPQKIYGREVTFCK